MKKLLEGALWCLNWFWGFMMILFVVPTDRVTWSKSVFIFRILFWLLLGAFSVHHIIAQIIACILLLLCLLFWVEVEL
jgi:hypothetical protein